VDSRAGGRQRRPRPSHEEPPHTGKELQVKLGVVSSRRPRDGVRRRPGASCTARSAARPPDGARTRRP